MEVPTLPILFATAAVLGVIAHLVFFKCIEIDTHPLLLFTGCLLFPFALSHVFTTTLSLSFVLTAIFISSLFISILAYRAFLHPLHKFSGPFPARLTKFWALLQTARTGLKWHQVNASLHEEYGDYVRTGPR